MINEIDIIWIAGFFDGEGNIAIFRNLSCSSSKSPVYNLTTTINHTNKTVLSFISDLFGGSIREWKTQKVYSWTVTGAKAGEFLNTIYPYLKLKNEEVNIANKFLKIPKYQGGKKVPEEVTLLREQCLKNIKDLHTPGRGRPRTRHLKVN